MHRAASIAFSLCESGNAPPLATQIAASLNSILDVEASHLALSKMENVSDRLVS